MIVSYFKQSKDHFVLQTIQSQLFFSSGKIEMILITNIWPLYLTAIPFAGITSFLRVIAATLNTKIVKMCLKLPRGAVQNI